MVLVPRSVYLVSIRSWGVWIPEGVLSLPKYLKGEWIGSCLMVCDRIDTESVN